MSGIVEQLAAARENNGKRGRVNNKGRLAAFKKKEQVGDASWATCSAEWMYTVVVGMTRMSGAVMFGVSRDGGAHSLTLFLDKDKTTLWFNGDADLDEALEEVVQTIDEMNKK